MIPESIANVTTILYWVGSFIDPAVHAQVPAKYFIAAIPLGACASAVSMQAAKKKAKENNALTLLAPIMRGQCGASQRKTFPYLLAFRLSFDFAPWGAALRMTKEIWDGRDSNPDALSGCRFSHHYGFRHRFLRLWSGLCLDHMRAISRRPRPSSLYTFSFKELGSALSRLATETSPTLSASRKQFPVLRLNQC